MTITLARGMLWCGGAAAAAAAAVAASAGNGIERVVATVSKYVCVCVCKQ